MTSKKVAVVDRERCVSCGVCENSCPTQAAGVYKGCFSRIDKTLCVGCGKCVKVCPANCIELKERTRI